MGKKKLFILVPSLLLCILAFQNCGLNSNKLFSSENTSPKVEGGTEDNGHPYDGKIFDLVGSLCPDGTDIQARIVLKSEVLGDLVRRDCSDITPIEITSNDFQIDSSNPLKLTYLNQSFSSIGIPLDMSKIVPETGYAYWTGSWYGPFNNAVSDSLTDPTASHLQLYEDGKPLGPAHSLHDDIRNIGLGRYSHWSNMLRFSASDNSNPLTNGRLYTWEILP